MAIDFWKAQQSAKSKTLFYFIIFLMMTAIVAFGIEWILQNFFEDYYHRGFPLFAVIFCAVTFIYAFYNYAMFHQYGGSYVAQSLGAKRVHRNSSFKHEAFLYNICEEIAVASSLPMPEIFLLDAKEINAFAAGLTPDKAAITITDGALKKLSREELQGVIAHEFGHIYNGDMKIGLRLAAMVAGFFVILSLGIRLLQFAQYRSNDEKKSPMVFLAIALLVAGAVTWLGGSILRCLVSQEREYLADATAVQFTRDPTGLAGALIKIEKDQTADMPALGEPYAHLYFNHNSFWKSLFATHPPIQDRIAVLLGESRSKLFRDQL